MVAVFQCLQTLKEHFTFNIGGESIRNNSRKKWNVCDIEHFGGFDCSQVDASSCGEHSDDCGEERKNSLDSKFQHVLVRSVDSGMVAFMNDRLNSKIYELRNSFPSCILL